jgi:hypothetical protein
LMQDHMFPTRCKFCALPSGCFFGKVVVHRYHETVLNITGGGNFIGKNTGLQVSEILGVICYRRF